MPETKKKGSKKKVKQTQKQSQKQSITVNIDTKKKKSTTKQKRQKKQQSQGPQGRMSGQMAYYRQLNAPPPLVVQNLPNNNELVGAIQGLLNKSNPAPVPAQYDPELLQQTMKTVKELNDNILATDKADYKTPVIDETPPPFLSRSAFNSPGAFKPVAKKPKDDFADRNTPISPSISGVSPISPFSGFIKTEAILKAPTKKPKPEGFSINDPTTSIPKNKEPPKFSYFDAIPKPQKFFRPSRKNTEKTDDNSIVNPVTGRRILKGGPTYNNLFN